MTDLMFEHYLMISFFAVVLLTLLVVVVMVIWLAIYRPNPMVDGDDIVRVMDEEFRRVRIRTEKRRGKSDGEISGDFGTDSSGSVVSDRRFYGDRNDTRSADGDRSSYFVPVRMCHMDGQPGKGARMGVAGSAIDDLRGGRDYVVDIRPARRVVGSPTGHLDR